MSYLAEQCLPDGGFPHPDVVFILSKLSTKGYFSEFQKSEVMPVDIDEACLGVAYTEITAFKKGIVCVNERLWVALSNSKVPIAPGQNIRVTALRGHTLLVEQCRG